MPAHDEDVAVHFPDKGKRFQTLATLVLLALFGTLFSSTASAPTAQAAAPGPKDATAVMFSWTWNAIARECTENLGPAGYGFVQTSPPQEHVQGPEWWTHYQPVSYKVESRLGTRAEFKHMVDTCHTAGVKVIADAVINHMSGKSAGGTGWAGTTFQHYDYPGNYQGQDFSTERRRLRGQS
ncbi:alpha-amylase family glycosyl hydrolase [Paenarthrobacter sp.]|uniref:alpha-amylase family glycosyl hydrolase n=1 Tax=Paenarthrobacter sp. TaxID=1931993 RepID=UPI0028115111|nr:alpha-amylase family glycosyl hydrolase [Paenarthrobacter sp.]